MRELGCGLSSTREREASCPVGRVGLGVGGWGGRDWTSGFGIAGKMGLGFSLGLLISCVVLFLWLSIALGTFGLCGVVRGLVEALGVATVAQVSRQRVKRP